MIFYDSLDQDFVLEDQKDVYIKDDAKAKHTVKEACAADNILGTSWTVIQKPIFTALEEENLAAMYEPFQESMYDVKQNISLDQLVKSREEVLKKMTDSYNFLKGKALSMQSAKAKFTKDFLKDLVK